MTDHRGLDSIEGVPAPKVDPYSLPPWQEKLAEQVMEHHDRFTDWRGTPIHPGSKVVYPGRGSSSMWLVEGLVMEVIPDPPNDRRLEYGADWLTEFYPPERRFTLLVQPIQDNRGWRTKTDPVKLTRVDRVTVVE